MDVTINLYNKEETEVFHVRFEKDYILLSNKKGHLFAKSEDLFDVLQNAFDHKMITGLE